MRLRKELADAGLDAGPETIAWHLEHHHGHPVSRSTISRHLTRSAYGVAASSTRTWSSSMTCTVSRWSSASPSHLNAVLAAPAIDQLT